ncbi:MAG: hypothetical protein ACI85O_002198 [Saprospiraceae bacterium]|jgi:hypothetical protein
MKSLLAILCTLLFLLPIKVSEACGPYDNSLYEYSFFDSKIVADGSEYAPYFLNFSDMYDYYKEVQEVKQNDNLEEWRKKVCEYATPAEIRLVIYKSTPLELNLLRTAIKSEKHKISGRLKSNSFAQFLEYNGCMETIDYLIYAKSCEPHVVPLDAWNEDTHDYAAMEDLLNEGLKRFKKTNSNFLKLRYAYQIIRLAHYKKEYSRVLELHASLMPKIDEVKINELRSLVYYWIVGHRAGALLKLGDRTEAAYLYSRIFAECPSKRESAFRSFSVKSQEEWNAVLKRCASDEERSVIYTLRANGADSQAIYDMETIYGLYPHSPHLEVLLVKEIKELERDLLGLEWNKKKKRNKRYHKIPRAMAGDYVIKLQKFARKCRIEKQVTRPELWYIAEGYLEFLAGDNYAAAQTFNEVRDEVEDEKLQEQLAAFELALKIAVFDQVDDETELAAYDILKDNELYEKYESFPSYLRDRMTRLYTKRKRPGKAFRTQHSMQELRTNPQEEIVNDLMKICQDTERNTFERLLVENADDEVITNELWDMKAVMAMEEYQLEAALLAMKKIPRTDWDKYGRFDPFRPTIKDCMSCPHSKDSIDLFNRGMLIEKLLDLEAEAKGKPEKAAINYFKIGTVFYNISFFGHSWKAMDYFRSGSTWNKLKGSEDGVFKIHGELYPYGNKEMINVNRAKYYLNKSRILSDKPELSAQATFMAAKCELAEYYTSKTYKSASCANCIPYVPEEYSTEYKLLKEGFGETQFYGQLIEECAFFRAYLAR